MISGTTNVMCMGCVCGRRRPLILTSRRRRLKTLQRYGAGDGGDPSFLFAVP